MAALTTARRLEPDARVMVFIDGQNVYKTAKDHFQHGYCHPVLLARELAGDRRLVGVRYYSGIHDPNVNPRIHASVDRRHKIIGRTRATVIPRQLAYRWEWGYETSETRLPDPRKHKGSAPTVTLHPYRRAREKGIDVALALDVVDLAVNHDLMDVALIVSEDGDLTEAARVVHSITASRGRISVEAAVVNGRSKRKRQQPVVLKHYDFTHQIDRAMFDRCRDDFDYHNPLDEEAVGRWIERCRAAAQPGCV